MDELLKAVEMGRNSDGENPFEAGTDAHAAWSAGRRNDLAAWLQIFNRRATVPKGRAPQGRLRAHDPIVFNAHTAQPDHGEFLGYDRCPAGWCRVLLNRHGRKSVPVKSITRPKKMELAQ